MIPVTNREKLLEELSPFSDIGELMPKVTEKDGILTLRMTRGGRPFGVSVDSSSGKVLTSSGRTKGRSYASLAAMLASEDFANLRRWAEIQNEVIKRDAISEKKLIPINGKTHIGAKIVEIQEVDNLLGIEKRNVGATEILLIDGPAGIGKTNLIEQLALLRAANYKNSQRAPILHVKSRGRVLSNIQDLMAFSLQTIRSNITYDQIPVLVRYGLIVVAIDGFDELGDPNGYELAWSQLGEFISFVRGNGTIILSGRDTFMGRERLIKDVHAIRENIDIVTGLSLNVPTSMQAKAWLKTHQWTDADFEISAITVLLEDGSFALRPVFLKLIGENIKPKQIRESEENYLTSMLVSHLIEREAGLFGKAVNASVSKDTIKIFLRDFLCETARDMADSQTESVDSNTLGWIAEAALGDGYPSEIVGLIKNRANVVAFLVPDERMGHRKFINSYLMNFFLSHATIEAINKGELPKYMRRNLLGAEFLSVFSDVIAEDCASPAPKLPKFLEYAIWFTQNHSYADRGIRNVGTLLLSALPYFSANVEISNFQVDEAVMRGTASPVKIVDVNISQADCRGADLSSAFFRNVGVVHVIGSDSSRFPSSFPLPKYLTDGTGAQLSDPLAIEAWLNARGRNLEATIAKGLAPVSLSTHPIYKLLGRACRIRQYWLRAEDDIYGAKIFMDKNWPQLREVLAEHNFLREETRQASGRASVFVHIRQRERILSEDRGDSDLAKFFNALADRVS